MQRACCQQGNLKVLFFYPSSIHWFGQCKSLPLCMLSSPPDGACLFIFPQREAADGRACEDEAPEGGSLLVVDRRALKALSECSALGAQLQEGSVDGTPSVHHTLIPAKVNCAQIGMIAYYQPNVPIIGTVRLIKYLPLSPLQSFIDSSSSL
eukprot:scaffold386514_cov45-Prasinocladus_malaysianus.AAC.2